ncbi:hypothetical protein ES708_32863 [subsurface metagenome]
MKKNILKIIGTLTFLTLMFFNVQFIFSVDNNGEKVDLRLVQSEALATNNYTLENFDWGCECIQCTGCNCDVSAQCMCSWGNCECCEPGGEQ